MNLGTFTKHEDGIITGKATTLVSSFEIEYRPVPEKTETSPDYRVFRKGTDIAIGFAQHKFGETSGKSYLNTMIDTPEFPRSVWMALVKEEDGSYVLKWNRPRRQKSGKKTGEDTASSAQDF